MSNIAVKWAAVALLLTAPCVWAADPANGEINDETLKFEYAGSGPFIVPNASPDAGDPVCPAGAPQLCDSFMLNVNISDDFRALPENQRENVRFAISFPVTVPVTDYEIYVYDAAGALLAEASNGAGVQESVTLPLKTLKNGAYTVTVVPYAPFATNYMGVVQVGKDAKAAELNAASANFAGAFGFGGLLLLGALALRRLRRQ